MSDLRHAETDYRGSTVSKRQVIAGFFLIAHEQLPEAIEPGVTALNDPPSGGLPSTFRSGLLGDLPHVGRVAAFTHGGGSWFSPISFVGAQVLRSPASGFGATHDNPIQGLIQKLYIMAIGAADDKGERGAKTVDQQAALGPFFFPDPSDWVRRLLERVAPCPWCRRYSATSKRSPPSHHIPPGQPARAARRTHRVAIAGSAHGSHSHCQNYPGAPSTGNRCAAHRQWLRRFAAAPSPSVHHLRAVDNAVAIVPPADCARPTAVPLWPRVHQTVPMLAPSPCPNSTPSPKINSILIYG